MGSLTSRAHLSKPAVVGAGIVFRPVISRVAATRSRSLRLRRTVYRLRRPREVGASFTAQSIATTLAPSGRLVRVGDGSASPTKIAQTRVGLF